MSYAKEQQAFHENRERLKAERLKRAAATTP
jgi:transcription elongation GreA/GreB family factor